MSNRKELATGTTIYKTDLEQIMVGREKGRGGSAIVYEGQKITSGKPEFCLIKEIYPSYKDILRNENCTIQADSETGKALYQRVLAACEAEVHNYAKLVGSDAPRNDIMLRASEYISPEMSENGNAYLILDTVECKTLADIKKLSVYDACKYIEKLLAAVSYVHQKGALHLDIAPDNIIIAETTDVVRLIDFNSSCFKDEKTGLYHSGSSKKGFSASEVRDGFLKNICCASDLFSVAAVLYTMIFGELYVDIENSRRQTSAIRQKIAEKFDNVISKPAQRLLTEILCKGLAHYASERYQTAGEMLAAISELAKQTAPTEVFTLDLSTHTCSSLPSFCQERNSMLEAIHQKLEKHNHVFVSGIGGSGKSVLSAMFVNKYSDEYDAVQTINFVSCKDVIKAVGFAGINDNDSYYKEHPDDLYAAKLHALQTKTDSRTLIIVENYTKRKDDQFDDLMTCPCRIIFNTRNMLNSDNFLTLDDIDDNEALKYFMTVSEREEESETIKQIIPYTDRNFLLMKLLALKLRNSPNITAEFVLNKLISNEKFDKGRFSFDKFDEETQEEILREVFNISDLSSEEIEVLSAMTLVPYCGIKQTDYEQALKLDVEENPIGSLVRLGWIIRTGKGTDVKISLHQTISDLFARSDETKPDLDKLAPLLEIMSQIYNVAICETFAEREEILSTSEFFARRVTGDNLACAKIYYLVGYNFRESAYFQRALEYYNKALKINLSVLGENHPDTAINNNNIGAIYYSIGDYDKALEHYKASLRVQLSVSDENDPEIATCYNNVGGVYTKLGDYDKALDFYNKALNIQLSALGEDSPGSATIYNNIGLVYNALGDYDKALEHYNTALRIQLLILGENDPEIATYYNNMGFVYAKLSDYDKALEYLNKALDIQLSALGENNPNTATSYNNIGLVYDTLGNYDKALEYYNTALRIQLSVLGESHPDTAISYNNIGSVYNSTSDYDKALEHFNKALNIQLSALGEDSPDATISYDNIGLVYNIFSDYNRALECFNKALKIRLSVLGENHLDTIKSYIHIGNVYNNLGDYDKALEHFNAALTRQLSILGENHPNTASSYNFIGLVYTHLGDYNMALDHYNKALKIQLSILGENHPDTATSYNNIGFVYYNLGDYDKALEHYKTALRSKLLVFGENHPSVAQSYNSIGLVYNSLGDYNMALDHYNKALKIQLSIFGENHPITAACYNNIGLIYNSLGDYNMALDHCNKALKIQLSILGENHPDTATSYNNVGLVYYNLGYYDKTLEYYNASLKIQLSFFGESHPNIATSYNNVGLVYDNLEEYEKALEYYNKALKIRMSILDENDLGIAESYNNVGSVYVSLDDEDKALECFNAALKIRLSVLGENDPDTAESYYIIGCLYYYYFEDYDKALDNYNKALKIRLSVFGKNDPDTAETYYDIGTVYDNLGNYDEALKYFETAFEIRRLVLGEKHSDTVKCRKRIEEINSKLK